MSSGKVCSKCAVEKPLADFYTSGKRISTACRRCHSAYVRAKQKEAGRPRHSRAGESRSDYYREWASKNRDKLRANFAKWYAANPGKGAEARAAWARRNPAKVNAWSAAYRAQKLNATPPWVSLSDIAPFYAEAAQRSAEGAPHEVDHIVPLNHPEVCGLHVPWNLQVIPETDNRRKSNRLLAA